MALPFDSSPLVLSIATTCAATVATFFLGLFAARAMYALHGSLRAWIDGVLTLPLVLPPTVVGFLLLLLFGRRSLIGLGLEHIGIMIAFSWPATVIAATVVAFPLMYRTSLGALEQVNPTMLQAARTLGASEWVVFRSVQLPLAGPGVVAGTVLAFARAMGEFGATLMLAGNIPGRTQTMPIAIFSAAESGDMRAAALWVALIVAISLGIIWLLNYEKKRRPVGPQQGVLSATDQLLPAMPQAGAVVPVSDHDEPRSDPRLDLNFQCDLEKFRLNVAFRDDGGTVGLLGASGAGKSMTLRIIAGVTTPNRGRIVLNNRVLFDSEKKLNVPAAQRRVGLVFQDYALFPHLTVAQNVGFGLRALPREQRDLQVSRQLASMQIAELAHRFPREISGGQRQRVAIARCLAVNPDALLFDEPFAALDPHLRRQTEEQLRKTLADYDGPVVFVTHDMEEAFRFCSDLLVLDRGNVIASGPKHQLFEDPQTVVAARLTGCKNIVSAVRLAANRLSVPPWNCELATSRPIAIDLSHVGYRSHQVRFVNHGGAQNTFACWLVSASEAPHEMTLYLRLHGSPKPGDVAHLQADVPKDLWRTLAEQPQPWHILLDSERLLLLKE